jgi:hypothetical protein
VPTFDRRLGIVKQPDLSTRIRTVAVERCNQEIDLHRRSVDRAHQIAHEDKGPLQQPDNEQAILPRIERVDLPPEFQDPRADLVGGEDDTCEIRVPCGYRVHPAFSKTT